MSSSEVGPCPHHSESRWPSTSASSARARASETTASPEPVMTCRSRDLGSLKLLVPIMIEGDLDGPMQMRDQIGEDLRHRGRGLVRTARPKAASGHADVLALDHFLEGTKARIGERARRNIRKQARNVARVGRKFVACDELLRRQEPNARLSRLLRASRTETECFAAAIAHARRLTEKRSDGRGVEGVGGEPDRRKNPPRSPVRSRRRDCQDAPP